MLMKTNDSVEHLIADELYAVIKHQDFKQDYMNGVINAVHKNVILVRTLGLGKSYSVQNVLYELLARIYALVEGFDQGIDRANLIKILRKNLLQQYQIKTQVNTSDIAQNKRRAQFID